MSTKLKGDLAEQEAVVRAMERGWGVLRPYGDRLPYDLAFDLDGVLVKAQVKAAWPNRNVFTCESRRTKTNRRTMVRAYYEPGDFDFALVKADAWYVLPADAFMSYKGAIAFGHERQRTWQYREAWALIETSCARSLTQAL
jgi:hypothetical protein